MAIVLLAEFISTEMLRIRQLSVAGKLDILQILLVLVLDTAVLHQCQYLDLLLNTRFTIYSRDP